MWCSNHNLPVLQSSKETTYWSQEVRFCRSYQSLRNVLLTHYRFEADVKLPVALQALAIFASSKISAGCKCLQLPTPTVTSVSRVTVTATSTGMNALRFIWATSYLLI
jgi:hypothetical protein